MYRRILLALDLEGVNLVAGEAYQSLGRETAEWEIARAQAAKEVNAAAEALFAAGAEAVGLWDNHGGGGNVDRALLDPRITWEQPDHSTPRMRFAQGRYDCLCFFGYHAMEGTLGGVLAHTMNSKEVQFYKLNGKQIGEVDMDAYIAASLGMPSCFFAGGNIACAQAARAVPGIVTVVTKEELGRNEAIFRENDELLAEIKRGIVEAVSTERTYRTLDFPAMMEKSFKRVETAAWYLSHVRAAGVRADYLADETLGFDAHTVVSELDSIDDLIACL